MSAVRAWETFNKTEVLVLGYYCEACDEDHFGHKVEDLYRTGKAWYCTNRVSDEEHYFEEATLEDVWWCASDYFFHDTEVPTPVFAWKCSECESYYLDKDTAEECCS